MHIPSPLGARLGLSGSLEFKDASGNVLKRVDFVGSVPLAESGLSVEQAQQLITQQGANHGCDDRE
jgi:hypothetical protein